MKVALGVDVIRFPLTGIGRYAYELAKGLGQSEEVERLFFLSGRRLGRSFPSEPGVSPTTALSSLKRFVGRRFVEHRCVLDIYRSINDVLRVRALMNAEGAVYHGPNYYLPAYDGPSVATFHDLSVLDCPEFHPPERVAYMRSELPVALERADVLLTISEHARQAVLAYSGFSPERVLAVPLAASSEFKPRTAKECAEVLVRFGLGFGRYVLYAGTVEPRKNLGRLLDAYEILPARVKNHFPLVVAGYRGWCSDEVHVRLQQAQSEGWAFYLGFVSASDLPVLYSGARIFAFPSLYEGFGLPLLEAMASGVPVVCSDSTSLPEVGGGYPLMCAPDDVDQLSHLLVRAIEDEPWRERVIPSGIAHAGSFSWERTVTGTLKAYRAAMERK
ncbi:glycosyltransferase family 4 protein [Uliginosibacterium paludis]|uniref:Glycosyltransferase family 1 protein n=1 Tax=Uliginosibacterium paludis TaxID=1615952 RepID=A0ABV2CMQ2_9RHOO